MTISATTQGLRMGVATSTSRPTVPFDGQVISETDTDSLQVYKGSAWGQVSGLVRVGGGALSGTSIAFASVFSATYNNYILSFSNLTVAGADWVAVQMTGTSAGYYYNTLGTAYGATRASFVEAMYIATNGGSGLVNLGNPFLAKNTVMSAFNPNISAGGGPSYGGGWLNNTTSYTGCTILCPSTITAGTLDIYGLALS